MVGEASMVNYLSIHIVMYFFKGCFYILFIMDKRCCAHQSAGVWEYKISWGKMPTRVIASLYINTILLFI